MIRRAGDERGFALPAVIFLVALLTLLLTTGLARVQADRQIAEAGEATADAFAIAQSGLQNYMGSRTTRPPDGDSVRVNLTGGYANVVSRVVRNPADTTENSLYLVRSTGFVIDPLAGAAIQAQRSVAQFADWQSGTIEWRAALTAASGLTAEDDDAATPRVISGFDECGGDPIPGARTDTDAPTVGVTYAGSTALIEQGAGAQTAIANQTEIDWAGALSSAFVPDYTTFQNGDTTFPIQRIMGYFNPGGAVSGSGLLIVRDSLRPTGSGFYFEGVILVGGGFNFDADSNVIHGLVVTGLNRQLGLWANPTDLGGLGEISRVSFNSCKVSRALAALAGMAPLANGWLDTWATY
jgi:hypothetical protein